MQGGEVQKSGKRKVHKECEGTLGGDPYTYHLDCSDGLMGVCVCQKVSSCTFKICTLYFISITS